jgi:hypothetical protein
MSEVQKGQVYNVDVYGLDVMLNRTIVEIMKSQSSGVSGMISFDIARVNQYLGALKSKQAWVGSQPQVDCPETGPKAFDLVPVPVTEQIENDAAWDLVQLLQITRDELRNSQSARLPSGLIKFDDTRLTAFLGRMTSLLNDYIAKVTPIDLPESSPSQAMSGAGATGV